MVNFRFRIKVIAIVILEGTGKVTYTRIQTSAEQGPCDIMLTMLTKSALRFFSDLCLPFPVCDAQSLETGN